MTRRPKIRPLIRAYEAEFGRASMLASLAAGAAVIVVLFAAAASASIVIGGYIMELSA